MKKLIVILIIISVLFLSCSQPISNNGIIAKPYGMFSLDRENPNVLYATDFESIVVGVIFVETIFVPIIVIGWYIWKPIGFIGEVK